MSYASKQQLDTVASKINSDFAKKDGVYTDLTAGNLVDPSAVGVSREFTFDKSCGTASISDTGTATIKQINGRTIVPNQLVYENESKNVDSVLTEDTLPEDIDSTEGKIIKLGGATYSDNSEKVKISTYGNSTQTSTETYEIISNQVANNRGNTNYPLGTTITDTYTYNNTSYDCQVNVVDHYDVTYEDQTTHPGLWFEWEYTTPQGVVFDPSEATLTVKANKTLVAGTYNILIGYNRWVTDDNTKYAQFTTTSDLVGGNQLRLAASAYNASLVNGSGKAYAYEDGKSTTALMTVTITEGQDGTFLGTLWGTDTPDEYKEILETQDGTHYLNHYDRTNIGYNRWAYSYARQYLNSSGYGWWVQQHCWDRAPANVDSIQGFMSGLSSDLVSNIKKIKVITPKNNVTDGGGNDITYDKIFLHSKKQMCWTADGDESLNHEWEYYRKLADEIVGEGKSFANYTTYAQLIRYSLSAKSTAQYVWSICAFLSCAYDVWGVGASGNLSRYGARYSYRVLPAYVV